MGVGSSWVHETTSARTPASSPLHAAGNRPPRLASPRAGLFFPPRARHRPNPPTVFPEFRISRAGALPLACGDGGSRQLTIRCPWAQSGQVLVETDRLIGLRGSHVDLSGVGGSLLLVVICTRLLFLLLAFLLLAFLVLAFLVVAFLVVAFLIVLGGYSRRRCCSIDGHPQLILISVEPFRPVNPRCPRLVGRCSRRRCSRRRQRAHRRTWTKTVCCGSGRCPTANGPKAVCAQQTGRRRHHRDTTGKRATSRRCGTICRCANSRRCGMGRRARLSSLSKCPRRRAWPRVSR